MSIGNQWIYDRQELGADVSSQTELAAKYPALAKILEEHQKYFGHPVVKILNWIATASLVYHGYKRNGNSVGWAIGWFFVPNLIGVPLALAQGFGKRK